MSNKMSSRDFYSFLIKRGACRPARRWVRKRRDTHTPYQMWRECNYGPWMVWLVTELGFYPRDWRSYTHYELYMMKGMSRWFNKDMADRIRHEYKFSELKRRINYLLILQDVKLQ